MTWVAREDLEIHGDRHEGTPLDAGWTRAIEFAGLEIPLLAFPNHPNRVVLGTRRARAVRGMAHFDDVPVYVAPTALGMATWMHLDRELAEVRAFGVGRPWTWRERAVLHDAVLDAYSRQRVGGGNGTVVQALAEYFGVHEVQLRNAAYLLRFTRTSDTAEAQRAARFLDLVEAGELLPQSAYRKLRNGDPTTVGVTAYRPQTSAREQLKALQSAGHVLSGITQGLERIGDLHLDLSPEDRASVREPIENARRVLSRLARQLNATNKGDSNG